jgi:hypothetical protein
MDTSMAIVVAIIAGCFSLASASYARALDATPARVPIHWGGFPAEAMGHVRRAAVSLGAAGGLTGALIADGKWEWGIAIVFIGPTLLVSEWLRWQHNAAIRRTDTMMTSAS